MVSELPAPIVHCITKLNTNHEPPPALTLMIGGPFSTFWRSKALKDGLKFLDLKTYQQNCIGTKGCHYRSRNLCDVYRVLLFIKSWNIGTACHEMCPSKSGFLQAFHQVFAAYYTHGKPTFAVNSILLAIQRLSKGFGDA